MLYFVRWFNFLQRKNAWERVILNFEDIRKHNHVFIEYIFTGSSDQSKDFVLGLSFIFPSFFGFTGWTYGLAAMIKVSCSSTKIFKVINFLADLSRCMSFKKLIGNYCLIVSLTKWNPSTNEQDNKWKSNFPFPFNIEVFCRSNVESWGLNKIWCWKILDFYLNII